MNIEYFIATRKKKGFSQKELAEGICTQATLSRLENNGQIPTLKILIQLCNRLELPLGDLFPKVGAQNTRLREELNQGEFYLITSEYDRLADLLAKIDVTELDGSLLLQYYYLQGFVMIFRNAKVTDILFTFDQLLAEEQKNSQEIYRLLAYTGMGLVYLREKDLNKAGYYFQKVLSYIYEYPTNTIEEVWKVLTIVFHCGLFYGEKGDYESSDGLFKYVFSLCAKNHVTYYLARAVFQLAQNAVDQTKNSQEILELLQDARAYAKVNDNQRLLEQIEEQIAQLTTK
ncbi:helix-turn-helix domain-containing protein [Enterococcus sp. 2201sp1_2201st1_B8_2201SCRN_220225]|uniref:helix-turn-helix domain-containing protein n=1 Tax=unclassified Enterococcus TaxID=2608891 RepID=UPI0034A4511E